MSEPEQVVTGDSPAQSFIGYVVHIFEDRTEVHLELREDHLNRRRKVHGGILALMMDSACGYAASRALHPQAKQLVVSLNLQTNFLNPAEGESLTCVARVDKAGRKVVFSSAEIRDANNQLVATGNGTFKAVGR